MGLDITAYKSVVRVNVLDGAKWASRLADDESVCLVAADAEEFRCRLDGMVEGYYYATGNALSFRVGSYSSYNRWREHLAALVGTTTKEVWSGNAPQAFGEPINFSDSSGSIGPKTSAKLARDFSEWWERAKSYSGTLEAKDAEWFLMLYSDMQIAFETASGNGVVSFH